jgi:hypothetical protein
VRGALGSRAARGCCGREGRCARAGAQEGGRIAAARVAVGRGRDCLRRSARYGHTRGALRALRAPAAALAAAMADAEQAKKEKKARARAAGARACAARR